MNKIQRVVLAAIMLLALGAQIGCDQWTQADTDFVKDLAQDWLRSRNMSPTDENGDVDYMGSVRFAQAAVGRSDDDEANAVFGIYTSISGVIAADKAMDEARANGDAAKMDEVIADRPHDWSYRSSRAVLALAQGDTDTYQQQMQSFSDIAAEQGVPEGRQARQLIEDYQTITVPDAGEPCTTKYMTLMNAYNVLYKETGEQRWYDSAAQAYATMLGLCP